MSFIAQMLFLITLGHSASEQEQLAKLLTGLNQKSPESIAAIESLFAHSHSKQTKKSAALLLAYLPESQLQKKPHEYASYALKNDSKIENAFSLYRITGDGYFQSAQFKEAAQLFKEAQSVKDISEQDKIYFIYKEAWSYLNLKQPHKSYELLLKALTLPASKLLRQPMVVDLGQSYGEAFLNKGSVKPQSIFKGETTNEEAWFVEGLLKAYRRFPENTRDFYRIVFHKNWLNGIFPQLFEVETIAQKGPCEVMSMKQDISPDLQQDPRLFKYLNACATLLLNTEKVKPTAFIEVARWYETFAPTELVEFWTLQKLYEKSSNQNQACQVATKNVETVLQKNPEWAFSWLKESIAVCEKAKHAQLFEDELSKNKATFIKTDLFKLAQQENLLSNSFVLNFLQQNENVWSSTEYNDHMLAQLRQMGPTPGTKFLLDTCKTQQDRCDQLWLKLAEQDFLWVRSLFDSNIGQKIEHNSRIKELVGARSLILDKTTDFSKLPDNISPFKDLAEDFALLKKMETYRGEVQLKGELEDAKLFEQIEQFQAKIAEYSAHVWSTKVTKERMQHEVLVATQTWQKLLRKRGKTNEERQQWKMLAAAMNMKRGR